MKGLDLHRNFFTQCAEPILAKAFPHALTQIAVASVGFGSDRLGADDAISQDHCWEPGVQLFSDRLPRTELKEIESYLSNNLPWEFRGFKRSDCPGSPNTIRAWTVDEFFESMTSFPRPPDRDRLWLLIADEALSHVTNGEVFWDPTGDFTKRRALFSCYPENVWLFKLAGRAFRLNVLQYQAERSIQHGEDVTTSLIVHEGLREIFHFVCLANRRFAPYDRWLHWTSRRLSILAGEIEPIIANLLKTADVEKQVALYKEALALCADWAYAQGLATKDKPWWAGLREAVQGELKCFRVPSWIGVEYRYSSQFGLGGNFIELLTAGTE